jgi:flagellar hook-basal body complex protein FliE
MPIGAVEYPTSFAPIEVGSRVRAQSPGEAGAPGFSDQLISFLREANTEMASSEQISTAFAAGDQNNIHETLLSAERANIAFRLVGSIRNRMLEAYTEVMRMSV